MKNKIKIIQGGAFIKTKQRNKEVLSEIQHIRGARKKGNDDPKHKKIKPAADDNTS